FELAYDPTLFNSHTITPMVRRLRLVLEGIITHPHHQPGELPILTPAETHQLLVEWNDTALDVPVVTFPKVWQAQVTRTPNETALVCGNISLTFAELNTRANQLAHHLITLGVGPERLVALALPRSADMIIALLAVFKAGGAYLPIDPDLPADRIRFMLTDARPVLVLASSPVDNIHHILPPETALL